MHFRNKNGQNIIIAAVWVDGLLHGASMSQLRRLLRLFTKLTEIEGHSRSGIRHHRQRPMVIVCLDSAIYTLLFSSGQMAFQLEYGYSVRNQEGHI